MGLGARTALPDNDSLEDAVREYIAIFCADTQPAELAALRRLAVTWMERMEEFRPYPGAQSGTDGHAPVDIYLQLFCDDPKSAELKLIENSVDYTPRTVTGFRGESVEALSVSSMSRDLGEAVACTCWSTTTTTCAAR